MDSLGGRSRGGLPAVVAAPRAAPRRSPRWATAPLLVAAASALAVASLAAFWLPVWQWDALGYHLPYVNFALVARSLDGVPDDMPYVSTYPHNVEMLMIALRAMLPDDRLVDTAQIPAAVMGGLAIAGIARRCGAARATALAAGAAWIVVPAVFLQMPTDYVDVAMRGLLPVGGLLRPVGVDRAGRSAGATRKALVLGGLALGPLSRLEAERAPVGGRRRGAAPLGGPARRAKGARRSSVSLLVAARQPRPFVLNALRYGNPVWPVEVHIGPIFLHGKTTMQHLLESGAAAPHLRGPLLSRVVRSWTVAHVAARLRHAHRRLRRARPRGRAGRARDAAAPKGRGGLGGRCGDRACARSRRGALCPGSFPRCSSPSRRPAPPPFRRAGGPGWARLRAGSALAQIAYAWPGLTGEGPPLFAYARMTDAERARAVGADGPPTPFMEARERVGPGETFAFDQSLELPYLAWESDLRYRAVWIPDTLRRADAVERLPRRARTCASSPSTRTARRGKWLDAEPGALPETLPVQIGAMLGVRSSLMALRRRRDRLLALARPAAAAAGRAPRRPW